MCGFYAGSGAAARSAPVSAASRAAGADRLDQHGVQRQDGVELVGMRAFGLVRQHDHPRLRGIFLQTEQEHVQVADVHTRVVVAVAIEEFRHHEIRALLLEPADRLARRGQAHLVDAEPLVDRREIRMRR
jgi:hypothetical protein